MPISDLLRPPPPPSPPPPIRLLQALVAIAVVNTDFRRARAGEFAVAPPSSSSGGYEALADAEAPAAAVGGSGADAEEPEPRTWISLFWDTCLYVWPESFVLQV